MKICSVPVLRDAASRRTQEVKVKNFCNKIAMAEDTQQPTRRNIWINIVVVVAVSMPRVVYILFWKRAHVLMFFPFLSASCPVSIWFYFGGARSSAHDRINWRKIACVIFFDGVRSDWYRIDGGRHRHRRRCHRCKLSNFYDMIGEEVNCSNDAPLCSIASTSFTILCITRRLSTNFSFIAIFVVFFSYFVFIMCPGSHYVSLKLLEEKETNETAKIYRGIQCCRRCHLSSLSSALLPPSPTKHAHSNSFVSQFSIDLSLFVLVLIFTYVSYAVVAHVRNRRGENKKPN